ncbi:MAG: prepilin-type N-terminal cleavage/methylation domain-containing protein [Azoarcus sp.]|jgi:type IV pilus assembly protein PilW|nr:prepilin-type N-terminal cleavage/methylation domain-containing protein [Azoarcus sp.]
MTRLPVSPALSTQRGLTLVELMISMLLGLIVVGGVLGIFVANSETNRRTGDLARIQENARAAVQSISRSMREAGGNPCGIPPDKGLIIHTADAPTSSWWSGGEGFTSTLSGYAGGNGFSANGNVTMVAGSDAVVTVSGNAFTKAVISDSPPGGPIIVRTREGFAANDILFACSMDRGLGVVFKAGGISASGANWQINRATPFVGTVAAMTATSLGKVNAEGWFVGENVWGGTSLFRAFIGGGGQPEEIAQGVSNMTITYLLSGQDQYVTADAINDNDWPGVIAAYIELTVSRTGNNETINRTVGLTVNLRNRFVLNATDGETSP